ncbi:adenylate/guanylate cyclase domain-containing protein [Spirosoma agri]|uniref:Adenylate/guanylate cyclase domain-containing protein n=1 Tax=Spirosoma agri TaxID=1987381 RepID=A0A6M0IJ12_9BACT|nr:adenylate/guanylate cyclase domain-containing protein [Spirosoma agri]NEU68249.1 adenylate/guanylate cyclase domain-containing protein [Spirosoma agri]
MFKPIYHRPALTYFQHELEEENFRRERQRAVVLAALFAFGFLLYGITVPFGNLPIGAVPGYKDISVQVAAYMGGMLLYELFLWQTLGTVSRRFPGTALAYFAKFGNATVEITVLTGALYLVSQSFDHPILMLLSPVAYLYFIFITLSTLRLSATVSVWTGALAGIEFYGLSLYLIESVPSTEKELTFYLTMTFPYALKALVMILTGAGAAYVARQIRQSIQLSIERMETGEQIRTLFGQQVSPEVVEAILAQKGTLEASHRKVAVLFLDIRNFTHYADTHTPDDVIAYQSAFFDVVATVIRKNGGIINQFLGDGCMVTFGAPLAVTNPAERAIDASLGILEAVAEANQTGLIAPTSIGIGIQTGDAVVGNIGTEFRQQYNITGTVVIQASRIEQLNKEYNSQILVSQEVIDDLSTVPANTRRVGSIHLKGMSKDVMIWQVA